MRVKYTISVLINAVVCCGLLLLAGCEKKSQPQPTKERPGKQELLIGLIPEQNVFRQRERYRVLNEYLREKLGMGINFTSLSRYGNIIERFTAEKMDGAFFGSFTYTLAHHQLGVEPLVRPVNLDGTSTYHGYIFVRKDSGIRSVAHMRGKRFAFVERATTAGYVFPLAYFREQGIHDPHGYLGETFFTGSHDAAIEAVLNREADIGAAKNTIYDNLATESPRLQSELVILATSGVVPQNCLAVRKDMDPELKKSLKRILLDMDKQEAGRAALEKFGARSFIETTDQDFANVYALAAKIGVDIKTYRYENK